VALFTSTISWRGSTEATIFPTISPGSCTQCKLHKGANFTSIDPETGNRVNLFNPRRDTWEQHFAIDIGGHILGLTPTGKATVRLLDMNGIPQLNLRQMLITSREFDE
jgi:hypothetical protein